MQLYWCHVATIGRNVAVIDVDRCRMHSPSRFRWEYMALLVRNTLLVFRKIRRASPFTDLLNMFITISVAFFKGMQAVVNSAYWNVVSFVISAVSLGDSRRETSLPTPNSLLNITEKSDNRASYPNTGNCLVRHRTWLYDFATNFSRAELDTSSMWRSAWTLSQSS